MYERIVVALDGSALAELILPHVSALAEKFGSTLTLVRAVLPAEKAAGLVEPALGGVPVYPDLIEDTLTAEELETTRYLEHVANELRRQGLHVQTNTRRDPAVDALVDCAHRIQADLVALTTHGRGGLGRLVYGSVADGVVRSAPCPVLLVRASAKRATRGDSGE